MNAQERVRGTFSVMEIDPGFLKIWYAWLKWMGDVPYWDPYGAAVTLVICGFGLGFFLWKMLHDQ